MTPMEARRELLEFLDHASRAKQAVVTVNFEQHQRLAALARLSGDARLLALIGPAEKLDRTDRLEKLKNKLRAIARLSPGFKSRRN